MSSQNQAACETSPLLGGDSRPACRSGRSLSRDQFKPETLLIPFVFATRLGTVITSTTLFELFRQAVCRFSNISHGDPSSLGGGPSHPELCDAPEVVRNFATVSAIVAAIGGITSMLGCGILNRISPHYGRKPVFLFILITEITWSCLIAGSHFMPDGLADRVFLLGMIFHLLSGALPSGYLVNMYIVDVCVPENRTTTLSKIGGWSALGACIPLALGGTITTQTGNPFIVFYIAATIFASIFIYVVFILPETFPEEKRNALRPERSDDPTTTCFASVVHIFEPLRMLVPARTTGGKRNWRLTWCAAHNFVFLFAHPLASSAWLVLVTSKYHLTPADNGIFFTIAAGSSMIVLTVIAPSLIRFLRPYYSRRTIRPSLAEEGPCESQEPKLETSDRLDVHLAFASCVIVAAFLLCTAVSTTKLTLIVSAILMGCSAMHSPTIRSLIVGSVDPLKQGDAMAAIEMVDSASRVLSPLIMGGIVAATIDTAPQLVFYVQLAIALISAELLLLVRDADRYRQSNDT